MHKVVLFLHKESKYAVLGQMIQDLKKAFERIGIQALIHDCNIDELVKIQETIAKESPDCTWGINIYIAEHFLYYPFGIPHVDLSVDSVTYSCPEALIKPHIVSLFVDQASCDLFSAYSDNPVYWFPHAMSQETIDQYQSAPSVPLSDRSFDVVLMGSFLDHDREKQSWSLLFGPSVVGDLVSLAERALADPSFSFLEEIQAYVDRSDNVKNVLESKRMPSVALLNSVERYARGLERERLLKALTFRNVTIFTGVEDAKQWSQKEVAKRCHFELPIPFTNSMDIFRNSKIVIHSAPHIRKGYHERLFLALASGAVTFVRKGHLLPSWLVQTGRVVEYKSSSLQDLKTQLDEMEQRPFDQEKIFSWLKQEHTWDVRLRQILPAIDRTVHQLHVQWESNPFWHISHYT